MEIVILILQVRFQSRSKFHKNYFNLHIINHDKNILFLLDDCEKRGREEVVWRFTKGLQISDPAD